MFTELTGSQALIRRGGVFKPAKLYEHRGELYIAAMGGYVRVYTNGGTTVDKLNVVELHYDGPLTVDRLGRLRCDNNGSLIEDSKRQTLMLGSEV